MNYFSIPDYTVEGWEWISNFLYVITHAKIKVKHVSKRGPSKEFTDGLDTLKR